MFSLRRRTDTLSQNTLNTLLSRAGYLVSMSVRDIRELLLDEDLIRRKSPLISSGLAIPSPSDEPVIGDGFEIHPKIQPLNISWMHAQ